MIIVDDVNLDLFFANKHWGLIMKLFLYQVFYYLKVKVFTSILGYEQLYEKQN